MIVPLSNEQLDAMRNIFPRTILEIDQDLTIIRHWLDKQPHLPKISDDVLKKFMFSLKYRMDKIKIVIDNFYTVKESYPQYYHQLDPCTDSFRKIVNAVYICPLPKLTPDLSRVYCYRMASLNSELEVEKQIKRHEMMWSWLFNKDPLTLRNVWIFDTSYMTSMAQWGQFNLAFLKNILKICMDAKPVRIKKIYIINVSSIADTTLNLIKHFFPQKFRDRFVISSNVQCLQEDIPLDMLPNEWGGQAGSLETLSNEMYLEMVKSRDWYIEMEHVKADSRKRIIQKENGDESILGVEGNFKKLNVD